MDNGQKILREWLARKLKEGGRGTRTALATHLGLRNEVISRMLKPSPERGSEL
ncbi:MAG: Hypothetical protein BHV28_06710 [Candidatus Tokpelaia hoelldobleri]|uniref:Uncharacterized protein n=1 Tax=Candidatus Tokpelaia hoelldobleri TaxID=1902579 RepID=A0A1U9JU19_9HYPH|nr:MAG: Hypothetical protein BHV28_06710 [Candidatus Tokpelaia hoelldoblerii]